MKKRICVILISIVSVLCLAFGLSACSKVEFKVSFVVDEQTVYTINTNGNEVIAMPPDPQKKDYIFDGWYWDKDVWEKPFTANSLLDAPLSSNMNVYCKWRPKHEHAYTEEVIEDKYKATDASCTHKATYYYVCECGEKGTEIFEYGELLQHTPKAAAQENFVDSTCTQEGSYNEVVRCKDCDTVISTTPHTIEKKQHTPKEAAHENEVDSTCTNEGHYDEVIRCSVCDTVISSTPKTIEKKQHTPKAAAQENFVDSTCTKEGSYNEVIRCEVCDGIISSTPKTIEKKQHTPKAAVCENVVDSTCTQEGSYDEVVRCDVCNTVISSTSKTIEKKPHTWSDWTEKDNVSHKRTCGVCKTEETENHELGGKNGDVCTKCAYTDAPATIKSITGATINQVEKTVKLTVDKNTTRLLLSNMVTVSSHSGWKIYDDSITEVVKTIPLTDGYNTFYITVTDTQDSSIENTYTFTVYKSFEVTLNYYGVYDDIIHTETIVTGYEFTVNYTPEITGYTFNHWKLSGEQTTKFMPFDDVNLYADCTANLYNVTFVTDSKAQAVESFTATYDKEVTLPTSSKTGYTFNGWLDGGEISQTTFVWKFTEDKEYTAKFIANQYTITYVPDGGTVESTSQNVTYDREYALYGVSRTGYTFTGWYNGNERVADGVWERPDDITLTAHWRANTYTVTFDANGGTCGTASLEYVYDDNYTLPEISRVGYTFTGWYNGDERVIDGVWKNTIDCKFMAHWQINSYELTVVCDDNVHGSVSGGGTYDYNTSVTATATGKSGYTFMGWYNGETLLSREASYTFNIPAESVTYTAKWTYYTLSTATNNSSAGSYTEKSEYKVTAGENVTLTVTTNVGYTWLGWYNGEQALTKELSYTFVMPAESVTYTAKWTPTVYDIVYELAGGSLATDISSYNIENEITLDDPTRIGYDFSGWFDNDNYRGSAITEIPIGNYGNKTFYAKWTLHNYSITYVLDGGAPIEALPETYTIISDNIILPEVEKNECYFVGWYADEEYKNAIIQISSGSYGDRTVYVKFLNGTESLTYSEYNSYCTVTGLNAEVKEVVIPKLHNNKLVKYIDGFAFENCSGLTSITIPNSVTSIGSYAFENCSGLTSITIPNSVTSIGNLAFFGCSGLTSIYYTGDIACWCSISGLNSLMAFGASGKKLFIDGQEITGELIIPDGITTINGAFAGCSGLTSITIPDSVTAIGNVAFFGCSGLTSITIPNSVTTIDSAAFRSCSGLTSITIPDSVTSISDWVLANCSGLTSITIPNSVTSIGDGAFYGCSSLTSVYYKGTEAEWDNISIIGSSNDYLTSATRYYYSETEPTEEGNYWHYDGEGNIVVWKKEN